MNGHPISWATEADRRHNTNTTGWCPGADDPHEQCLRCVSRLTTSTTKRTVEVDYTIDPPMVLKYGFLDDVVVVNVCRIVGVQIDRQPPNCTRELQGEGKHSAFIIPEEDLDGLSPVLRRRVQLVLDSALQRFTATELRA